MLVIGPECRLLCVCRIYRVCAHEPAVRKGKRRGVRDDQVDGGIKHESVRRAKATSAQSVLQIYPNAEHEHISCRSVLQFKLHDTELHMDEVHEGVSASTATAIRKLAGAGPSHGEKVGL